MIETKDTQMNVRKLHLEHSVKSPTEVDVSIGANIRRFRRLAELSMEQLAPRLGVSMQQLQKYETAASRVSGGMIARISNELKIPILELFPFECTLSSVHKNEHGELSVLQRDLFEAAVSLNAEKLRAAITIVRALAS